MKTEYTVTVDVKIDHLTEYALKHLPQSEINVEIKRYITKQVTKALKDYQPTIQIVRKKANRETN
jgi:hypothetical protein